MEDFEKTLSLFWFYLRKDWLKLLGWLFLVLFLSVICATIYPSKYPTESGRAAIIQTLQMVSMKALFGPIQNQTTSIANVFSSSLTLWTMLGTGIMAILVANGSSRKQEDTGLLDVILARPVGKLAPIIAAFLELLLTNGLIVVLCGIGLDLVNLNGSSIAGNWLFACGVGVIGLFFGCLTLLIAQFANNSEENTSISFILFVVFYLIFICSMISKNGILNWINPFEIVKKMSIYHHNDFSCLLVILVLAIIFFAAAVILNSQRDIGTGIFKEFPVRSSSPFIRNYPELVIKTQFKSFVIWSLILLAFGLMYG